MNMFKTKCRCGTSEMSFKKFVGEFYIDTCCQIAGYDHLGNLKKGRKKGKDLPEPPDAVEDSVFAVEDVTPEVKSEERSKRPYNRSGNIKTES